MSGDWRGTLGTLLLTFCIVIIRFTDFLITLYFEGRNVGRKEKRESKVMKEIVENLM
jgi:hypothetical protein